MSRHLVTSALPYINGIKHLGNLVGSLLPADVYARLLRACGEEVLFICGTDEHGTPAEIAAHEAGTDVATYCAAMHERQAEVYRRLGIAFDHFGRTSSAQNRTLTQHFYRALDALGLVVEGEVRQFYSEADRRFLPDRYVVGTCPHCGYEVARGDQCERCSAVLDPQDLLLPRSALSGATDLEARPTRHLFFEVDKVSEEVERWIGAHCGQWSRLVSSTAHKWLREGLKPRCITRDLKWGVDVPRPGFEGKVFYVWFDAPVGYIGATREWSDLDPAGRDYRTWWFAAADVEYVQFMAKDNLPFHTIFFPAMILGAREPWTLPARIKGFHWLNYYRDKFSTSRRRGVFLDQALDLYPADYWRYALLSIAPESADAEFTWETFAAIVNKDLVGIIGNFVQRVLALSIRGFGPAVPSGGRPGAAEDRLAADARQTLKAYASEIRRLEFRGAIRALRQLWSLGNLYLDRRAPWALLHQDRQEAALVLRTAINLIRVFATASSPIIPFSAQRVLEALGVQGDDPALFRGEADLGRIGPGHPVSVPPLLFQRIPAEAIGLLRQAYGGTEADGCPADG